MPFKCRCDSVSVILSFLKNIKISTDVAVAFHTGRGFSCWSPRPLLQREDEAACMFPGVLDSLDYLGQSKVVVLLR